MSINTCKHEWRLLVHKPIYTLGGFEHAGTAKFYCVKCLELKEIVEEAL